MAIAIARGKGDPIRAFDIYVVIHQDRRQIVRHERRDELGRFLTSIAPADSLRPDLAIWP